MVAEVVSGCTPRSVTAVSRTGTGMPSSTREPPGRDQRSGGGRRGSRGVRGRLLAEGVADGGGAGRGSGVVVRLPASLGAAVGPRGCIARRYFLDDDEVHHI